jgi:hypothetical protein
MSVVESAERAAPPKIQIPQRHVVDVRAMVSGLGPSSLPLLIRDVSRRGMYLAFEGEGKGGGAGVDAQWISIGTAITIAFETLIDGRPRAFEIKVGLALG